MTIFCPVGRMPSSTNEVYCVRESDLTESGAKRRFKNMYGFTSIRLVRIAKMEAREVAEERKGAA